MFIPGMEAADRVDHVGAGVEGLAVGDTVMAVALPTSSTGGAYREQLVLDADQVAMAPATSTCSMPRRCR